MPRIARGESVGGIYHIINRGNMRMEVFDDNEDFRYFLALLETACKKFAIELHAYALMPNHFHLLVVPKKEKAMSRFMQWLMTSHVRFYHKKRQSSGHVWQGRFKSFVLEQQSYYLNVLRYIEANALRAKLVKQAQVWPYSSLYERIHGERNLLSEPYLALDETWVEQVNTPMSQQTLADIRNSVNRQAPLGEASWQLQTAKEQGLLSTLNARGRPKKVFKSE